MSITVNREDVQIYINKIKEAAEATRSAVLKCAASDGLKMLYCMKFEQLGHEPLDVALRLNLVEQIHQTFTCLVSFAAAKELFRLHPKLKELTMNIGNANGADISGRFEEAGTNKNLTCEGFAAVDPDNNRKLATDINRVQDIAADIKYVFFFAPGYTAGLLRERSGVKVYVVNLP